MILVLIVVQCIRYSVQKYNPFGILTFLFPKLLEEIAGRTHPEYQDEDSIRRVFVVGSIGAGKSSFLYAVHKQLQYSNDKLYKKERNSKESQWTQYEKMRKKQ